MTVCRVGSFTILVTFLSILAPLASSKSLPSIYPVTRTTSNSTVCQEIRSCLKKLDADRTCPILPVLPSSIVDPIPQGSFNLTLLREGVWAYNDGETLSLIIFRKDHLALVDFPDNHRSNTNSGSMTRLTEAVDRILNGSIPDQIDMIYSHADFEHIGASQRFYEYTKQAFPAASIFILGTSDTVNLINNSVTKRAVLPNIILGLKGESLSFGGGLDVKLDVISAHTFQDVRVFIPRYHNQPAIVMHTDIIFPGWVPASNLEMTNDFKAFLEAQEDLLNLDFDILVPGEIRLGTKHDVRVNLEYSKDLRDTGKIALQSVTPKHLQEAGIGKMADQSAPEFGNFWFAFVGTARRLQLDVCYRIMLEKWGCRLAGIDFATRGHCLAGINYIFFDN